MLKVIQERDEAQPRLYRIINLRFRMIHYFYLTPSELEELQRRTSMSITPISEDERQCEENAPIDAESQEGNN